jgi:hypothetical protein
VLCNGSLRNHLVYTDSESIKFKKISHKKANKKILYFYLLKQMPQKITFQQSTHCAGTVLETAPVAVGLLFFSVIWGGGIRTDYRH